MKNSLILTIVIASFLMLSSCGINNAIVVNDNQNSTQVHLSSNNYNVVQQISGSAEVEYVLIFGGMNRKHLFETAYSNMLSNADLMNGSKAIVNVLTEEHLGGFPPFYYKRTVTVSAHVIEFTK